VRFALLKSAQTSGKISRYARHGACPIFISTNPASSPNKKLIMINLRTLTLGLLSLLFVSCTSYAPRLDSSFTPGPDTVAVYGQLKFVDNSNIGSTVYSGYRMALELLNEETKKPLFVRFTKTQTISCANIPAGHYQLTGFVATDNSDRVLGGKIFGPEDKINIRFTTAPNTAIYLGDFYGYVKYYVYGDLTTVETGLTQVTNNFVPSTAIFHEKYPNLAQMPVHSAFENSGN